MTAKEIVKAKAELEAQQRVIFRKGWVYVLKADKHNGYRNSPHNEVAYKREMESIPVEIQAILDSSIDTSIDSSVDSSIYTNQKPEIRNKNIEILTVKEIVDDFVNKFPDVDVALELDKLRDWLASKGKVQKDYVAFARNWLRRASADARIRNRKQPILKPIR
jgi:hypothetical protein